MRDDRLRKIVDFLKEVEKLKLVERINYLSDQKRRENDAEHSWHLALMVMALEKELGIEFDTFKTIKIALIHDLIEINIGDDWVTDPAAKAERKQKEHESAEKVFAILPDDLSKEFKDLWLEYEEGMSNEAKIAKGLDKISYSLQYAISKKIQYDKRTTREDSRNYALPHVVFNPALTSMLDDLLEEIYEVYEPGELK